MKKLPCVLYLWFPSLTIITVIFAFSVNTAFAGARPAAPRAISVTAPMQFKGVHLDNQVDGPCGSIVLTVNNFGGGQAKFDEQVSSSAGPIINLQYTLDWSNNGGGSGHFGARYTFPLNPWTNLDPAETQPGQVTATMTVIDHVGLAAPFGSDCIGTVTSSNDITA
jgi:hypothetical protein